MHKPFNETIEPVMCQVGLILCVVKLISPGFQTVSILHISAIISL